MSRRSRLWWPISRPTAFAAATARRPGGHGHRVVPREKADHAARGEWRRSSVRGEASSVEAVSLDPVLGNVNVHVGDHGCHRGPAPRARTSRRPSIPALEPERSALAMRLGQRAPVWHPVVVFLLGLVACYVMLAAATTALGLAFTSWILPLGRVRVARTHARWSGWPSGARLSSMPCRSSGSELSGAVRPSGDRRRCRHHLGVPAALAGRRIRACVDLPRVGHVPDDGVLRRPRPAGRPATRGPSRRTRASPRATSPRRLPSTPASRSSSRRA